MNDTLQAAQALGAEVGHNAGTWVIDGRTSLDTALRAIAMAGDGDPAWWEYFGPGAGWLSGEHAGGWNPQQLYAALGLAETPDEGDAVALMSAFETAADEAFEAEVLRTARALVEGASTNPATNERLAADLAAADRLGRDLDLPRFRDLNEAGSDE